MGNDQQMQTTTIEVRTGGTAAVRDLTGECSRFVSDHGDGLLSVFVPHATAGVAILETAASCRAEGPLAEPCERGGKRGS